jgi:hypothetical protein
MGSYWKDINFYVADIGDLAILGIPDVYDEQVFVQNPQEIGYTKKWKILKIILAIPFTISFNIGIVQSCEERFELG